MSKASPSVRSGGFVKAVLAIAVGVACLTMALHWTLYWLERDARAELRSLLRESPKPPTVNGFRLVLSGTIPIAIDRHPARRLPPKRTLLLVASDDCSACLKNLSAWRRLIDELPVVKDDELVVASFRGTHMPTELTDLGARRGLQVRPLLIEQQAAFAITTGITLTPTTAVLDEDERVRFITNALAPAAAEALLTVWNSLSTSSQLVKELVQVDQ
jgi:hypothetical protein